MRYRLRTLLIVLAMGPPVLAGAWFAGKLLAKVRLSHPRAQGNYRQIAAEAQQRLARLEDEAASGPREFSAGMSLAEIDQRFAEISAACESRD